MNSNTEDDNNEQHGNVGEMVVSSKNAECTSCEQINNTDAITKDFNNVAILDDMSTCANCGKENNSDNMNTCNKCKMVKYCNAACKKKHRSKHKKACERRVVELHDEQLFKEVEPECPICFLPHQGEHETATFMTCCGKVICCGCIYEMWNEEGEADLCPFCRTEKSYSDEEEIKRTKKLMEVGNARAFYNLAGYYAQGVRDIAQDMAKANELNLKAGELGCAVAYYNLGHSYDDGLGVEVDKKKAKHYWELAAMGGNVPVRYCLGIMEYNSGNIDRAKKHFILAARAGDKDSLEEVQREFQMGLVTKDEFALTLRAYHERQKEAKSDARDKAAASDMFDMYRR